MAAGGAEPPRPKAASEGPVVGAAGVVPCLELPTYAAACALLSSRYSCLVAGPHRRHIALSPRYLNRKRTGIREQLDAGLLRYSERSLSLSLRGAAAPSSGRGRGPRAEVLTAPQDRGAPAAASFAPARPGSRKAIPPASGALSRARRKRDGG